MRSFIYCYLIIGAVNDGSAGSSFLVNVFETLFSPFILPDKTHFFLWTRRNRITAHELMMNKRSLRDSNFNIQAPTKIYIHGFSEHGRNLNAILLKNELLRNQDCNFISVDWKYLAKAPKYERAVTNIKEVATSTSRMIQFLLREGANINDFHLIGFSLGAHVAGRIGAAFNSRIPRITGLDPALPSFSLRNRITRLDSSDAAFVDVIHTNGGQLGFPWSIGHIDFYVNGGALQPRCPFADYRTLNSSNKFVAVSTALTAAGCSHRKAVFYYIESVNSNFGFVATQCHSWIGFISGMCQNHHHTQMGLHVSINARGKYYLRTNSYFPFALDR